MFKDLGKAATLAAIVVLAAFMGACGSAESEPTSYTDTMSETVDAESAVSTMEYSSDDLMAAAEAIGEADDSMASEENEEMMMAHSSDYDSDESMAAEETMEDVSYAAIEEEYDSGVAQQTYSADLSSSAQTSSADSESGQQTETQGQPSGGDGGFNAIGGSSTVNDEAYDLTFFQHYGVNPFIDTEDDRFSTFAIDVDTASYSVMRRFVLDGNVPDPDSVRVEEFVNYFDQGYSPPEDRAFAIHVDGGPSPFGGNNHWLMRVGLPGKTITSDERKDATLIFAIDLRLHGTRGQAGDGQESA